MSLLRIPWGAGALGPPVVLHSRAPGTASRLQRDYPSIGHMVKAAGRMAWSPSFHDIDETAVKTAQPLEYG